MSDEVRVTLPELPPSANSIWRAVKGRVLKSAQYRGWLDATAWEWKAQAGSKRIAGAYALTVTMGQPDKRRRDLDNRIKPLSDALVAAGIVDDDSLCQRLEMAWGDVVGVQVTVRGIA